MNEPFVRNLKLNFNCYEIGNKLDRLSVDKRMDVMEREREASTTQKFFMVLMMVFHCPDYAFFLLKGRGPGLFLQGQI